MIDDITKKQCFTYQDIALKVDKFDVDDSGNRTGKVCVRVGLWNDRVEKYRYMPKVVAEVTVDELIQFSTGIVPRTVNRLLLGKRMK